MIVHIRTDNAIIINWRMAKQNVTTTTKNSDLHREAYATVIMQLAEKSV